MKLSKSAPLRAIHEYCINCAGGVEEAKKCNPIYEPCPLWKFRNGYDPDKTRNFSEETLAKYRNNFTKLVQDSE